MKRIITVLIPSAIILIAFMLMNPVSAQENTPSGHINISADLMSRYIWRGLDLGGSSASIQPCMKYHRGSFTLGAWGAYSLSHAVVSQESDLFITYSSSDKFSFTVTDYFFSNADTVNHYFNYNQHKTKHIFELSAKFSGTEKIPVSLMVATNIHGADAKKSNGNNQFSTYIELGYSFILNETGCNAFFGFTVNNPDKAKGETGFYGPSAGVINMGFTASKEIKISESFSLPVNASLITNPQAGNIFLVFGISI